MSKLSSDTGEVVALVTRKLVVNDNLVADLEYLLQQAKEGRISVIQLLAYRATEQDFYFTRSYTIGHVTDLDLYAFTESLSRHVYTWRNIADNVEEDY